MEPLRYIFLAATVHSWPAPTLARQLQRDHGGSGSVPPPGQRPPRQLPQSWTGSRITADLPSDSGLCLGGEQVLTNGGLAGEMNESLQIHLD